jgi:hypothetical protein
VKSVYIVVLFTLVYPPDYSGNNRGVAKLTYCQLEVRGRNSSTHHSHALIPVFQQTMAHTSRLYHFLVLVYLHR